MVPGKTSLESFTEAGTQMTTPSSLPLDTSPERYKRLVDRAATFHQGAAMLTQMISNNIPLYFLSDDKAASYGYRRVPTADGWQKRPDSHKITVSPAYADERIIGMLLHEMRHMQQDMAGVCNPKHNVSPKDLLWHTYMVEADAQSSAVIAALHKKIEGDDSVFQAEKVEYTEMFNVAEREYAKDPSSLHDGRLRRMVFDAWFTPAAKTVYAHILISSEYPRIEALLETLEGRPMKTDKVAVKDLEAIGICGGEDVNYMTLPGFRSLDDDYYRKGLLIPNLELVIDALEDNWQKKYASPATPAPRQSSLKL